MTEKPAALYHDQPLRLLRNVTYPTYQLHAMAGRGKTPPATVLTICVLQTLAWLRSRFRDLEVPQDLKSPEPWDHESVDPAAFRSFRIDLGYRVEVVWLPEEQAWTMQLAEPDLGSDPGSAQPRRQPVPGRLFETNIAYRVAGSAVECGFVTNVSDIEGTTAPCEVYRLAVVKHLARHPLVGLRQAFPLRDEPHLLETVAMVRQLQDWLKDKSRMMPAVVVAECTAMPAVRSAPVHDPLVSPVQDPFASALPDPLPAGPLQPVQHAVSALLRTGRLPAPRPEQRLAPNAMPLLAGKPPLQLAPEHEPGRRRARKENGPDRRPPPSENGSDRRLSLSECPGTIPVAIPGAIPGVAPEQPAVHQPWYDFIPHLARYKMGYAQFFMLPLGRLDAFRKQTGRTIHAGDILVIEPPAFGGESVRIPRQQLADWPEKIRQSLDARLQDYPKRKPMSFGRVVFLAEAKELERGKTMMRVQSREELLRASDERAQAAEARHREQLRASDERLALKDEKIRRLEMKHAEQEDEKAALRRELDELAEDRAVALAEKDTEIRRLHALLDRPADLAGIPGWVRTHLGDGLLFHPRAEKEIAAADPSEVRIPLLCDALEYLATDYREQLLGRITQAECLQRCHRKYNRNFEVGLQRGTTVDMYPVEYKIKYGTGTSGRRKERLMDRHLKVGDRNARLLRIYFLFDAERQLVVVGSLPRHLPTVSYNS